MDILAALVADPTLLPLWAVMLFAAGMYPIGMMFGCSLCCSPCACTEGSLPETLTVSLSGIPETEKGPDLATLTFSACYGSGASGVVAAPGQSSPESNPADDRGPVTAVTLTNGGSGYAKLGRAAPAVTVAGTSGSGSGATFDVTLVSSKDSCGLDFWAVSKVTQTGGDGYSTGDTVAFAVAEGDTQEQAAEATILASRIAPTVTVSGTSGSGSGAAFDVTLTQSQDSSGLDRWAVSKVTRSGGTGYQDGDQLVFTIADGDAQESPAEASITGTIYAEPTLSLSASGGTGAVLQINDYTKISTSWGSGFSDAWRISGITVANGGAGYTNDTPVAVTLGQDDEARPNAGTDLRVRTVFAAPTGAWTFDVEDQSFNPSSGSGIDLSITLSRIQSSNNWRATAVSIVSGGTGYSIGDIVTATLTTSSGLAYSSGLEVTSVDQNGAITGLTIWAEGVYPGTDTGVIQSVVINFQAGWRKALTNPDGVLVTNGGAYYREDENNRTVVVNSGGRYYREDASLPPYVATVTVGINQISPSQGSGASISATVGNDPENEETFGKITGLTINSGGDGYLAYLLFPSCLGRFNGRSIVVQRNYPFWTVGQCCPFFPASQQPEQCTYGYTCANTGDPCSLEAEAVRVEYRGPNEPMTVYLMLHQRGQASLPLGETYYYPAAYGLLVAQENVENCSEIDVIAYGSPSLPPEATAHITAGGQYEEDSDACKQLTTDDVNSVYVDVQWGPLSASSGSSAWSNSGCGPTSVVAIPDGIVDTTGPWCDAWKQFLDEFGFNGDCWEKHSTNGDFLVIRRGDVCNWRWQSQLPLDTTLCFYRWRIKLGLGSNIYRRDCDWCYQVKTVTHDPETLLPTGIELGPVSYGTFPPEPVFALDPTGDLDEATVCQDPGPPTITFSSLP